MQSRSESGRVLINTLTVQGEFGGIRPQQKLTGGYNTRGIRGQGLQRAHLAPGARYILRVAKTLFDIGARDGSF